MLTATKTFTVNPLVLQQLTPRSKTPWLLIAFGVVAAGGVGYLVLSKKKEAV